MSGVVASLMIGGAVAAAIAVVLARLWPDVLPAMPQAGERGRRRREGISGGAVFAGLEPLIRTTAAVVSGVPMGDLRARLERRLFEAGRPLGFDADDLLAASLLAAVAGCVTGGAAAVFIGRAAGAGAAVGAVFGAALPLLKIDEAARRRRIAVVRGLPQAIDLIALSMEAGLDFPGATRQVVAQLSPSNPLRFECEHLLHRLALGWSRQAALEELAARNPAPPVRRFVSSVVLAERRGTPLGRVLSTQAVVMRTERSQVAEQAAARAAVMIIGPLMLIFACVFIIILGPFVIKFLRGQVF